MNTKCNMRSILALIALFVCFTIAGFSQDKPAYQLFTIKGKKASFKQLAKAANESEVVFFGEQHNNPVAHWLQLALFNHLVEQKPGKVILGAEMFETDDQLLIEEYFAGQINQKSFEQEARLWNNYETDYKPLLEKAKASAVPLIATNVPRRYANLVYRSGLQALDSLSVAAKYYLPPLPIPYDANLPSYQAMLEMMGGHGGENLPKAQAIKDATMAHFITKAWKSGSTFLHLNGSYHSDDFEGIVWYLNQYRPQLDVLTISTVEQSALDELEEEFLGKATFILVVDETMTKTY